MLKTKLNKITNILLLSSLSPFVMAATGLDYEPVKKPASESNFQILYEPGTSFRINYGASNIVDVYRLVGGPDRVGALNVTEPRKNGNDENKSPRRTDSSFLVKKQGPLFINATWDGFNINNEVTSAYKSSLNTLITKYDSLNNNTTSKRVDFYLPSTRFATANFNDYALAKVGVKHLRPNTFRTKSISGGTVTYEYCYNSNNEAMYLRSCNTNGNGGSLGTFTIQYLTSVGSAPVCWHNFDRDENGMITIEGTQKSDPVVCNK